MLRLGSADMFVGCWTAYFADGYAQPCGRLIQPRIELGLAADLCTQTLVDVPRAIERRAAPIERTLIGVPDVLWTSSIVQARASISGRAYSHPRGQVLG